MEALFLKLQAMLGTESLFSSFGALVLAYFGGILSSFTPCIYPMIPITIGFIGGTAQKSVKEGWILSSFYVLGMACIYSILGLIAAASGRIFGTMTNTPGWYLSLGAILVFSALWMMEAIKIDPYTLITRISQKIRHQRPHNPKPREASRAGAFALGASSGFIASPCTTPVLTTILSYIATKQSIGMGGLLMFSFACGLGTILVLIGTFAGALKIMPRSGKWLMGVKWISALAILVLGQYFVFKAGTLSGMRIP